MKRMLGMAIRSAFACLALGVAVTAPLHAQPAAKSQATPAAVARESFDALKRREIGTFAAFFHPDETKRFKTFATEVIKVDKPDEGIQQTRGLFAPFDAPDKVAAAGGADLLAAFITNSLKKAPGVDEVLARAQFTMLGEIAEGPEKVHVIARTVLPRPQPVSCQKLNGRWFLLLNDDTTRIMTAFERKEHFRKKNVAIESIAQRMTMGKITPIGYVKDGDDVAQLLCRTEMKIDDFTFPVCACYPVRKGEPAWTHLDDKDTTKLVAALRAKWGQ
jgi:hypothetical protein